VNAPKAQATWLSELQLSGASRATIVAYRANTSEALSTIARRHHVKVDALDITDITRDDIVTALSEYHTRPDGRSHAIVDRSAASVSTFFGALRSMFAWCVETEHLLANPASRIKSPKVPKRIPKAMSQDECQHLLDAAMTSRTPERDRLALLFGLGVGLRLSEIASLHMESFIPDVSTPTHLRVIGKGNKERVVPVPGPVVEALKQYLPVRAACQELTRSESTSLFCYKRKEAATADSSRYHLGQVFERLVQSAGIKEPGRRAHSTRHSFATHVLAGGADILSVSDLLGHSSVATTQVYLKVDPVRLSAAVRDNPLMHLGQES
jgi:site-specific recombinase XerD